MLYYNAILTPLMKGPEISPDMRQQQVCIQSESSHGNTAHLPDQVKDNTRKLHTTDEFTCYFKKRVIKTQLRLVRTALFERMPATWKEWGDVIRRCDNALDGVKVDTLGRDIEGETGSSSSSRGLEEWFEKTELGGNGHRGHQHGSNQNCKHGEHEGTPMHRSA